jgi:hypothetical protein
MAAGRQPAPSQRGAVRLMFGYKGSRVRLLESQRVEMLAPAGEPDPIPKRSSGFWVELRDARGRGLYQQVLYQPIRYEVEVFPENHRDPMRYQPVNNPEGVFVVVVPDLPDAQTLVLFASPPEPAKASEPAAELLRVPLRKRERQTRKREPG